MNRIWLLLIPLFWLFAPLMAAADSWSKGTDGYYYANGVADHPYERIAYTVQERVKYCDRYGCCYYKYVPTTKYKYNRVYKITERTSLDDLARYFAEIKGKEVQSELRVREDYAKVQRIGELAAVFGLDQYKLQSYGLNLNYGEAAAYGSGYQFPPQTGNTQYGVKTFAADYYGDASATLVDVNSTISLQHELQKVQQQYAAESNETWKQLSGEIVQGQMQSTALLAQIQQQNETIALLGDAFQKMLLAAKPEGGAIRIRELTAKPDGGPQVRVETKADPIAVFENTCNACHEKHADVASDHFPAGVDFTRIGEWSLEQRSHAATKVAANAMPPANNKLGVAPLTQDEKQAVVQYIFGN